MSIAFLIVPLGIRPQAPSLFTLTCEHDSLYYLNEWQLPYPIYQFQTGDVDGDGQEDAMVGVVKSTRFYSEKARRLFIFKQVKGKVRPLWMGSRLGGMLSDFRYVDGCIRTLEYKLPQPRWSVVDYRWDKFGMEFVRYVVKDTDEATARELFNQR